MQATTDILSPSDRDRFFEGVAVPCVENGADAVTLEALADRSGLSEARFAEIFGEQAGIEECMLAAETAIVGDVIGTISATYAADRYEWDSGLQRMLAVLELLAANPSKAYFGQITARIAGPELREAEAGTRRVLASVVDRLRSSAPECTAPAGTASAVIGGASALIRVEIAAGRAEELPQLLPGIVYSVTVAYLGQELALALSKRARALLAGTAWG